MGRKRPELVMVILSRVWVYTTSGGEGWEEVGCGEGVYWGWVWGGAYPPQVWEGGLEDVVGKKPPELVMVILSRVWVYTASGGEGWKGVGCWEEVSPPHWGGVWVKGSVSSSPNALPPPSIPRDLSERRFFHYMYMARHVAMHSYRCYA